MNEIDELIHQKTRLSIMSHLYVSAKLGMLYLKQKTGISWGNLASHVAKLEEGGYVQVTVERENNKNITILELTNEGRKAFDSYREIMQQILTPED